MDSAVDAEAMEKLERELNEAKADADALADAMAAILPYIEGDRIAPWKPALSALETYRTKYQCTH